MKDYNAMIGGKNFYDEPVNNDFWENMTTFKKF